MGAVVAQAMAQFLASRGGCRALWLIDGDRYEAQNRDRVLFEGYENKAVAKARELSRAAGGRLAVRPVPEYATPRNVARLVGEGDIVFACVDNHASRRLIGNAAAGSTTPCSSPAATMASRPVRRGRAATHRSSSAPRAWTGPAMWRGTIRRWRALPIAGRISWAVTH